MSHIKVNCFSADNAHIYLVYYYTFLLVDSDDDSSPCPSISSHDSIFDDSDKDKIYSPTNDIDLDLEMVIN